MEREDPLKNVGKGIGQTFCLQHLIFLLPHEPSNSRIPVYMSGNIRRLSPPHCELQCTESQQGSKGKTSFPPSVLFFVLIKQRSAPASMLISSLIHLLLSLCFPSSCVVFESSLQQSLVASAPTKSSPTGYVTLRLTGNALDWSSARWLNETSVLKFQ